MTTSKQREHVNKRFEPVFSDAICLSCGQRIIAKNAYALRLLNEVGKGYCDGCRYEMIRKARVGSG